MGEIYRNSSQFEYLDIANGTADSAPTVALQRTGLVDVPLSPTHITSGLPSGVQDRWQVYIPLAQTQQEGDFTLQWSVSVGGEAIVKTDLFTVVTPYILPEEIARREGWVIGTDQTKSDLVIAERLARNIIDWMCNGGFGGRTKTVTVYGQQADVLSLPEPIQSIVSVTQDGVEVISNTYNNFGFDLEITETGRGLRIVNPGVNILESEVGDPVVDTGQFQNGSRFEINGIFGYPYVPEKIKDAAWLLAKDYLCDDSNWRNKYIKTATTQNWEIDWSSLAWWGTGNAMVDRLLDEWRNPNMLVI